MSVCMKMQIEETRTYFECIRSLESFSFSVYEKNKLEKMCLPNVIQKFALFNTF